jgi:hypothetical protein
MKKDSGYIVETKDGKTGRTFHNKAFVNKKVPVYLVTKPNEYSNNATLYEPNSLKVIGYID